MTARPLALTIRYTGELQPLQVRVLAPGAYGAAPDYAVVEIFARRGVLVGVLTPAGGPTHGIDGADGPLETIGSLLVSFALLPEPNWIEDGPDPLSVGEAIEKASVALDGAANRLHPWAHIGFETDGKARGDGRRAWLVVDDGMTTTVPEFKWRADSCVLTFPDGEQLYLAAENARLRLVEKLALIVAEPLLTLYPYLGTTEEPRRP